MRIALDTNAYVDLMRGVPEVAAKVRAAEELLLPFVVVAELRTGFLQGARAAMNERGLVRFLQSQQADVLWPDDGTTHHYAALVTELRARGTPIPTHDLWIAALCRQHAVPLLTRDRHFDAVQQLARI